jgi:hypothetical protein
MYLRETKKTGLRKAEQGLVGELVFTKGYERQDKGEEKELATLLLESRGKNHLTQNKNLMNNKHE